MPFLPTSFPPPLFFFLPLFFCHYHHQHHLFVSPLSSLRSFKFEEELHWNLGRREEETCLVTPMIEVGQKNFPSFLLLLPFCSFPSPSFSSPFLLIFCYYLCPLWFFFSNIWANLAIYAYICISSFRWHILNPIKEEEKQGRKREKMKQRKNKKKQEEEKEWWTGNNCTII